MSDVHPPHLGRPSPESQASELGYWEGPGLAQWDLHFSHYEGVFPIHALDFPAISILDVGSGPLSVFERIAPPDARVVPFDSLAANYNRIAPRKKFRVHETVPEGQFRLITLFNCLDHMDAPGELLEDVARRLAPDGQMWIYCHVDRPFDPIAHPQCFRFWQLVNLVGRFLTIRTCGLKREGRLFPYAYWAICVPSQGAGRLRSQLRRGAFVIKCGAQYGWFHAVRAAVKGVKLLGLRALLPRDLRF